MSKESTTRVGGFGVHAVMPRIAIAPRKAPRRRVDEREDDASDKTERAPPPPGMGALVDKSA